MAAQGGRHPHRDAMQHPAGQRALLPYHVLQAGPVHILDHQIRRRVLGIGVEHLRRAERRHLPRPIHLAAEPAPKLRIMRELRPDDLDRHAAAFRIAGQIDGTHAALAETGEQSIRPQLDRVASTQRRGCHPGTLQTARSIGIGRIVDIKVPERTAPGDQQLDVLALPLVDSRTPQLPRWHTTYSGRPGRG